MKEQMAVEIFDISNGVVCYNYIITYFHLYQDNNKYC